MNLAPQMTVAALGLSLEGYRSLICQSRPLAKKFLSVY